MNQDLDELLIRWPVAREFDLPKDSNIIIVGAYKGLTMDLLNVLYHPKYIFGYEPQMWAASDANFRLGFEDNRFVFGYGLGVQNGEFPMGEFFTDACSFVNVGDGSREQGKGRIREVSEAFKELPFEHIDLMVMNIEGYEFQLIPWLIGRDIIKQIDRLSIQFHLGLGNDEDYENIIKKLDKLYTRIGNDLPTWGYWKR